MGRYCDVDGLMFDVLPVFTQLDRRHETLTNGAALKTDIYMCIEYINSLLLILIPTTNNGWFMKIISTLAGNLHVGINFGCIIPSHLLVEEVRESAPC